MINHLPRIRLRTSNFFFHCLVCIFGNLTIQFRCHVTTPHRVIPQLYIVQKAHLDDPDGQIALSPRELNATTKQEPNTPTSPRAAAASPRSEGSSCRVGDVHLTTKRRRRHEYNRQWPQPNVCIWAIREPGSLESRPPRLYLGLLAWRITTHTGEVVIQNIAGQPRSRQ